MKKLALLWWLAGVGALAAPPYEPTWESIDRRPTPAWFQEAKFGIFIHWGLYSVPSWAAAGVPKEQQYAEWYWNSITRGRSLAENAPGSAAWRFHSRNYGPNFDYPQFAPMFRAELFDPGQWAETFLQSGARYVVLTSKHHEGFALWPSVEASRTWGRPWNSVDTGPKRDLLGDLSAAVRGKGLRMGIYYSLYEWYNPLWLSDKKRFIAEHMYPQFKDVVTRHRPSVIFSDGEWDMTSAEWRSPELLAWLFNESPAKDEVVINDRWGKDTRHKHGGYWTTEYTAGMSDMSHPWEENRGMGFSYGYNRTERVEHYRTGRELVLMLVDLVSRGGNLLLDIGPTGDGRIPLIMEERLLQIGRWLKVNGEAIYGTRPWTQTRQWSPGEMPKVEYNKEFMTAYDVAKQAEPPSGGKAAIDAFFTAKDGAVYAILPRWPGRQFAVKGIEAGKVKSAALLGGPSSLRVQASTGGASVQLPELPAALMTQPAWVLKLSLE
jgi:alpha-L-fucosidase